MSASPVDEPERYELAQAVRYAERQRPESGRVGTDAAPDTEAVRFRTWLDSGTPGTTVKEYVPATADQPAEVMVAVEGLLGVHGVLPTPYSTLARQRLRQRDVTLRTWLDLFQHRLLSLKVRAWEKPRLEAVSQLPGTTHLRAFAGIDDGTTAAHDEFWTQHVGVFSRPIRTADDIRQVLQAQLGTPVVVVPLSPKRLYLDDGQRCRLPREEDIESPFVLNGTAPLGRSVLEVQHHLQIELGPLSYEQFQRMQPGGCDWPRVQELVWSTIGLEQEVTLRFWLQANEVPQLVLNPDESDGPRLGRNVWLASHGVAKPVGDVMATVPLPDA